MLFLFHSFVVALNVYAIWYDQQYVDLPFPSEEFAKMPYKARGIFLTFWCLIVQTIYFTIALMNDVIGTNATAPKKPPIIRKIKDTLFSLAFPLALYVGAAFWGLYVTNRELILPKELESKFPSWLNHTMHTFIVPFITLELFLTKRNYPSRNLGVSIAMLFNLAYIACVHAIYFTTGLWVYPFLSVFSWPMKLLYYCGSSVIGVSFYLLGEKLDRISNFNVRVSYKNSAVKTID